MTIRHFLAAAGAFLTLVQGAGATGLGIYLGAGAGVTSADVDKDEIRDNLTDAGFTVDSLSLDDDDRGWKLFAGYQFNRYLSVELGYVDLGEATADIRLGGVNPGSVDTKLEMDGINLGLRAGYPFFERFSAFAKLGAFRWNADAKASADLASGSGSSKQDDSGTDISYGLGLEYFFNDRFGIRGDWDRYSLGGDADTDVDLFSASLVVTF